MIKSNIWYNGLFVYIPWATVHWQKPRNDHGCGNPIRVHLRMMLTGFIFTISTVLLVITLRATSQVLALSTSSRVISYQSLIKNMQHIHAYRPNQWQPFLSWDSLSSMCLGLCKTDKNQAAYLRTSPSVRLEMLTISFTIHNHLRTSPLVRLEMLIISFTIHNYLKKKEVLRLQLFSP